MHLRPGRDTGSSGRPFFQDPVLGLKVLLVTTRHMFDRRHEVEVAATR
jgi:hypothetical protein